MSFSSRLLFFKRAGDHRDLHSFPTRRSSDLEGAAQSLARGEPAAERAHEGAELPRSEEHTSELQSRPHLVCRLLLEKKNLEPAELIIRFSTLHPCPSSDNS